jgi:branched-chain amino acid aminotransferase
LRNKDRIITNMTISSRKPTDIAVSQWTDYYNGQFLPADKVGISTADMGFTLGDAAFEATRTYAHVPFHLDWHLDRLYATLAYLRIDPGMSKSEMNAVTLDVLSRNLDRVPPERDANLTHRITRGPSGGVFTGPPQGPPTVLITCRLTADPRFAHLYAKGGVLRVPTFKVPAAGGVDPRIKTQSRLLFSLGALEVGDPEGETLPLFTDVNGYFTESSGSNVFFVSRGVLITPPDEVALGGISRRVVLTVAPQEGIPVERRPVHARELETMDEVFVTSTGPGVLPIRSVDARALSPVPGPVTKRLMKAFSAHAGIDIVERARGSVRT